VKHVRSLNYRIAILPAFWLPEETLRDRVRQDGVRYDIYAQRDAPGGGKELHTTEGAIIDFEQMLRYVKHPDKRATPIDLATRFPLVKQAEIGYDPAFATELAVQLRDRCGFKDKTIEVLQNYKHLSEACQVFEALVKAGRVIHGGHRLLRWNLENVAIKTDDAGRIRPVKPKQGDETDRRHRRGDHRAQPDHGDAGTAAAGVGRRENMDAGGIRSHRRRGCARVRRCRRAIPVCSKRR
jgi:hypothetical protein